MENSKNDNQYDLIIIGGGPAGFSASIYAARKKLKTAILASEVGGQSIVSDCIENWIGTIKISGEDLTKTLRTHMEAYKDDVVDLYEGEKVVSLTRSGSLFQAATSSGKVYSARAVIIASGSSRRKLDVPGAEKFEHKGVTYCASCDGPLFSGMDVAVVGGGNAGFETAAQLLAYAKSVTLIHRRESFKADPVTVEQILKHPNMRTVTNVEPISIQGDAFVESITVRNRDTGDTQEIAVSGVFVEIGAIPNTDFARNLVTLNSINSIVIEPKTQRTSVEGVWAAGDCTDELYHQNNIAVGDAIKALEDSYHWIATHATTAS